MNPPHFKSQVILSHWVGVGMWSWVHLPLPSPVAGCASRRGDTLQGTEHEGQTWAAHTRLAAVRRFWHGGGCCSSPGRWATEECIIWPKETIRNPEYQTFIRHPRGFPGGSVVKNPPAMQEPWVWSLNGEDPWSRKWQPTPDDCPGRRLGDYNPWDRKKIGHDLARQQQKAQ